jgi:DNA-binding LytR/AlgR family response regulator
MKISCIIIEDEPLAMERTKSYVLKLPFLDLLSTFDSTIEAIVFLRSNPVDLIFLDINMGEFSGIQFLETSSIRSEVVITTAYDQYALKGFDLKVTDYLLKPFTLERFVQAIDRVQINLTRSEKIQDLTYLFVKTEYRLEKIHFTDILYIEGMRDYRRIHTIHKKIMTLKTFKEFEQEIPNHVLCRVHKSYMVAPAKIDSIERDRIRIKETLIPISETYKKSFLDLINPEPK